MLPAAPGSPLWRGTWVLLGALSVAFHLGLVFSGLVPNLVSRPLHFALALPWVMVFLAKTPLQRRLGLLLTAAGWAAAGTIVLTAAALSDQYGFLQGWAQYLMAALLLALVLEMARRAIGWPLPLVALAALAYGLFGQHIPGAFGHPGIPLASFLGTLTIAEGGLWGPLAGVSAGIVAVFVIFGAVLNAGEAGQGFMNLSVLLAGRLPAGAAKVSLLSSAFFGSISGSASANVASTGAFTLPAMKRLGYPPAFAGAVEAVASSGGQIMPPLMGAGAFVMVELLATTYPRVMEAAILPAVLFFVAVWVGVNAFARRYDLKPLGAEHRPGAKRVLVTGLFFLVPFAVLLERMLVAGKTPQYAAALAIVAAAALLLMHYDDRRVRLSGRLFARRLEQVALTAGQQIAVIASIILCASIVVGVLGLTGLGVKVTSAILSVSGDQLWPALLLTALACLVLGMEVPTTAAYVICVSVAGPALIELGLPPLLAHLFVFWYALLSTITPPVCGTVFIAAGMVGAPWLRVAGHAMALGIGLYLIPLALVASPALIAPLESPLLALAGFLRVVLGLWLVSKAVVLPVRWPLKLAGIAAGLLILLLPAAWFGLAGA